MSSEPPGTVPATAATPSEPKPPALEDILLALQKSFSRLSAASSLREDLTKDQARSLITGRVNFTLSVRLSPEVDSLRYRVDGPLALELTGTINHDVRVQVTPASEAANRGTPTPATPTAPPEAAPPPASPSA